MSNVDNRFMERFAQRSPQEQLNVYKQNLKQMLGEEQVDLSDLIDMCNTKIRQLKKTIKEQNGTPKET